MADELDTSLKRTEAIRILAQMIRDVRRPHPVRIGIDGVDGSGKTWLARELAEELIRTRATVISISIDNFHNTRSVRYARGRDSARGFYEDSYDYAAFISKVLGPLGPKGNRHYISQHHDLLTDLAIVANAAVAQKNAVLIVDGIFLHRSELYPHWDLSVYVHTDFANTLQRMLVRDNETTDNYDETISLFEKRYRPGQELYIQTNDPMKKATLVWNNNQLDFPQLTFNRDDPTDQFVVSDVSPA